MAIIPAPPQQPAGYLWWAGWYTDGFGRTLKALGKAIENVPIVGDVLSGAFKALGGLMEAVAQYLFWADDTLIYVLSWVEHLISGSGFLQLLAWASSEFMVIRYDAGLWFRAKVIENIPQGDLLIYSVKFWVLHQLSQISIQLYFFAFDPVAYLEAKIISFIPNGDLLVFDVSLWIIHQLNQISPQLAFFAYDPITYLEAKIISFLPQGDLLIFDVRLWVLHQLSQISMELYFLAFDPIAYIKGRILLELNFADEFLESPLDFLIEKGFERLDELWEVYADKIEKLVVNLILHFM